MFLEILQNQNHKKTEKLTKNPTRISSEKNTNKQYPKKALDMPKPPDLDEPDILKVLAIPPATNGQKFPVKREELKPH